METDLEQNRKLPTRQCQGFLSYVSCALGSHLATQELSSLPLPHHVTAHVLENELHVE